MNKNNDDILSVLNLLYPDKTIRIYNNTMKFEINEYNNLVVVYVPYCGIMKRDIIREYYIKHNADDIYDRCITATILTGIFILCAKRNVGTLSFIGLSIGGIISIEFMSKIILNRNVNQFYNNLHK